MGPRKMQKFCQLGQAIKAADPELYQALDDLCLLPMLRAGPNGVTFLYPTDKALRKLIIDSTYSKTPEVAVKLVKALILRSCFKKPSDIHGVVSNALNQLVEVKDGKWGSFTFAPATNADMFDHRGLSAMLNLVGKGPIPVTGTMAPRMDAADMTKSRKELVAGGFECGCSCWPSHRHAINKKIAKFYPNEYKDKKNNIYVKKVYAQLCILKKDYPDIYNSSKLIHHLGNDEISDSLLLDMITPDSVFCKIWKAMGQNASRLGELCGDMVGSGDFYSKYIELKQSRISQQYDEDFVRKELEKNYAEQQQLLNDVVSACDFRTSLISAYQDKNRLSKDLFIVYVSIMKEMWEHEHDMASYEHFAYMVNNVYTSCEDMINQEFNQFKDTTLHGNLLKSDVFKYVPWTNISLYTSIYKVTSMPKPIELKIYSLNYVVAPPMRVAGGGNTILGGYFA